MAIASNREIYYENMFKYVEHKTGKKLRSWKKDQCSLKIFFLFEDGSMGVIEEGMMIDGDIPEIKAYDIPKSFCASCGEEWHQASQFDWQGRCAVSLKKYWNNVRKVYWHRYIKNK